METIRASWKAVVALLIPIAFGFATEALDAVANWVQQSGYIWSSIVLGLITAAGVWLKANRPA